jgi:hypothetical protein
VNFDIFDFFKGFFSDDIWGGDSSSTSEGLDSIGKKDNGPIFAKDHNEDKEYELDSNGDMVRQQGMNWFITGLCSKTNVSQIFKICIFSCRRSCWWRTCGSTNCFDTNTYYCFFLIVKYLFWVF